MHFFEETKIKMVNVISPFRNEKFVERAEEDEQNVDWRRCKNNKSSFYARFTNDLALQ